MGGDGHLGDRLDLEPVVLARGINFMVGVNSDAMGNSLFREGLLAVSRQAESGAVVIWLICCPVA